MMPHIIGGDDILVSLPAGFAWPFVCTFLRTLDERLGNLVPGLTGSVSAGLVFARSSPHHDHRLRVRSPITSGRTH